MNPTEQNCIAISPLPNGDSAMAARVSVVVPVYNSARYLPQAISSVIQQTFTDWEVLMVDDGSKDESAAVAAQLAARHPDKVRLLFHSDKGNHGVSATRNLAIKESRGAFIAFLDADDVWLPHKLTQQLAVFAEHPDVGLVYGQATCINETGQTVTESHGPYRISNNIGTGVADQPFQAYKGSIMDRVFAPASSVVVRRELLERVGGFPLGLRHQCEDIVVWTKVAELTLFYFIKQPLIQYRIHPASWTSRQNELSVLDIHLEFLERLLADDGTNPDLIQGFYRLAGCYWQKKSIPLAVRGMRVMRVLWILRHQKGLAGTLVREFDYRLHRFVWRLRRSH